MEKVGGMFKSDKLQQQGSEKRAQAQAGAGRYSDDNTESGQREYGTSEQNIYE